ncbi:MAG: DUF1080 domain-containing protein [Planctomycetota bacterium]
MSGRRIATALAVAAGAALSCASPAERGPADSGWLPLFDGASLSGWTPKFSGHAAGDNVADTFRVEDGLLTVSYDDYDSFDGRFGHLFFDAEFSSYDLRAVYRFVGDQCAGAPGWAWRNNGLMFHGQTPGTMRDDQDFPVSVEAQLLGHTDPAADRPNGGVCTPGTNVAVDGEVRQDHCISSGGPTTLGDGWVEFVLKVRGTGRIEHWIDGALVHAYEAPQLDPRDEDAARLMAAGAPLLLERGTISIQAESHPIQFRTIELLRVPADG